jgi:LmbE family N-acetylglucosaminyl deacetylase
VSPHLDDAVLSAAQFIASRPDVVIATVCAGDPSGDVILTPYDRACGFSSSAESMAARRGEDRIAARLLGATTVHLGRTDGQYSAPPDSDAVAIDLHRLVIDLSATLLVGPLGLVHPDHLAVADAVLTVASERPDLQVWLYEDLPARVLWPEAVPAALDHARERGFDPAPGFIGTSPLSTKLAAVRAYRSQIGALTRATEGTGLNPVLVPERFWRLWS